MIFFKQYIQFLISDMADIIYVYVVLCFVGLWKKSNKVDESRYDLVLSFIWLVKDRKACLMEVALVQFMLCGSVIIAGEYISGEGIGCKNFHQTPCSQKHVVNCVVLLWFLAGLL